MASPSFEPPPLLVRQQAVYARLLVPSVVLAVLAMLAGAVEPVAPRLPGGTAIGLFGSFVVAVTALRETLRRDRRSLLEFALPAAACALTGGAIHGALTLRCPVAVVGGLGVGALGTLAVWTARARGAERQAFLAVLTPCALLPPFFVAGVGWTMQTAHFCPNVLDSFFYAMDTTLGVHGFDVGRVFARSPWITPIAETVYTYQWLGLLFVYLRQIADPRARVDALATTVIATACAIAVYYAFPVIGPALAFEKEFPWQPPDGAAMILRPVVGFPDTRNCVPSMHNAWAIMLVWHTRGYERWLRGLMWAVLAVTVAATLGFGYHYVFDIVVAVPFMLALHAATLPAGSVPPRLRRSVAVAGATMTALVLVAVRFGTPLFLRVRMLGPLLAFGTVVASLLLYRRLSREPAPAAEEAPAVEPAPRVRAGLVGPVLAGALGFVFVVYGLALARLVGLAFGGGAGDVTTPLALVAFGVALGAALSGRVMKSAPPLRAVALFSVLGGLLAASVPWQLGALGDVFASHTSHGGESSTLLWRVLLEGLPLLPLGIASGAVLPPLFAHGRPDAVTWAAALGGSIGAIVTGFWVLPGLGAHDALVFGAVGSLSVGLVAYMSARSPAGAPQAALAPPEVVSAGPVPPAITAIGGGLTLAVAVIYAHLLGVVVGDDVYSRSLALGAGLLALSLGGRLARRITHAELRVTLICGALAACLLATVFLWSRVPDYFASFEKYPFGRVFGERELIRLGACLVLSLPTVACLGALVTTTLRLAAASSGTDADAGRTTRRALVRWMVAQALGGGLGIVLVGTVLLPKLGSLRTLQVLALLAAALAIVAVRRTPRPQRRPAFAALALLAVLLLAQPLAFDFDRLASGENVHFTQETVEVVAHAESLGDGLLTAARTLPGGPVALFVDGNAETEDERGRDAVTMLLHAQRRGRALLLGGDAGLDARILTGAGFGDIDAVQPSATRASFAGAFLDPSPKVPVSAHAMDERIFLRGRRDPYDAILIDAPSFVSAAAAPFYSRELYALVRARLAAGGVVAERVPLERVEVPDVFSIIVTMNDLFPSMWLYAENQGGVLIACAPPCPEPREALARPLLDPAGVAALVKHLEEMGHGKEWLLAHDDDLGLAYAAARASGLAPVESRAAVLEALRPYAAGDPNR